MIDSDDMIADMLINEILNPIVTKLFVRAKKKYISLVFVTQSYFVVPKNTRLNSTYCFIMKIQNKQQLQQIAFNHLSDNDLEHFMNLYIR